MTNADAIRDFNDKYVYKDSAVFYRYGKTKGADGSTNQQLKSIPELSGLPCLMNIESTDSPVPGVNGNSVNMIYTMFISDLTEVKSGDYIRIQRHGKNYKFIAGESVVYDFHQEVPLSMKEWS